MWVKILFLFCVTNIFREVSTVYLKDTVSSKKYVPCNLGLLHFDKVRENYWKCTVNFGLYNMTDAVISIVFNNKINVDTYPNNYFMVQRTNKYSVVISSKQLLLEKFVFNVSTENLKKNDSDVPVVSWLTLNNITLCNDRIKAAQRAMSLNVTHRHPGKLHAHVCGRRPINHAELVTVRTEAQQGDWPWHVAIFLKDKRNVSSYHCGGNVISRTAILTAAHCVSNNSVVRNVSTMVIVAGIKQIVMHPAYKKGIPTSDLAIIKVNNIDFTDYVQPICVWGPVFDKNNLYNKEATTRFRFKFNIAQNVFNVAVNPLNGDSGGGLVFSTMQPDHKTSWFLRGILSKCFGPVRTVICDPSYYVVYTDVGPYFGWIYYHADLDFSNNIMVSYMN
ncbi:hypothetical protein HF086_018091 [Spodoptera exigua]|uniref:Peptidase S1 domain-containing protein n=1 Tax=Spodoptera exigua TaxID=7107 RepID=A0A922MQ01_SPOEX|nr:hypothetical protein HF086_018091 [Spodoptera exigua]